MEQAQNVEEFGIVAVKKDGKDRRVVSADDSSDGVGPFRIHDRAAFEIDVRNFAGGKNDEGMAVFHGWPERLRGWQLAVVVRGILAAGRGSTKIMSSRNSGNSGEQEVGHDFGVRVEPCGEWRRGRRRRVRRRGDWRR